jgi:hypothetical protein
MGQYDKEQSRAAEERRLVQMNKATPRDLYTISGNMAFNAKQASLPKPAPAPWIPTPSYPTYPTVKSPEPALNGNVYDPQPMPWSTRAKRTVRATRPHTPDWADRTMQRIPKWVLVCCSILGALFGLGYGLQAGAGLLSVGIALLGAVAGMLALPLLIKLSYLAVRVLAVAAVFGGALFIIWQFAQHTK